VLAPGSERKQSTLPRYRILLPEDEAEVERLYQRLKAVGHLDQKNSTGREVVRGGPRSFSLKFLIAAVVVCGVLYLTAGLWLPAIGHVLVYDEGPEKADIAVVLAGDLTGAARDRRG